MFASGSVPTAYTMLPGIELVPAPNGEVEIQAPIWGRRLRATRSMVSLLRHFDGTTTPEAVLAQLFIDRRRAAEFIEAAIAEELLVPSSGEGVGEWPDLVRVPQTLFNVPRFEAAASPGFAFFGAPFDGATSGVPGTRFGPTAIRQGSLAARYAVDPLELLPIGFQDTASGRTLLKGVTLADAGDVYVCPSDDHGAVYARVTRVVERLRKSGAVVAMLGGDHSLTWAALRAFAGKRVGLLQFDAHTDLGEAPSGKMHHGNFVSHALAELPQVEKVVQVGLRGVYTADTIAEHEKVTMLGMDAVRDGVQLLGHMPEDLLWYVSVDIDVVDPVFAPATGTPVANGLFPHELKKLLRTAASARKVKAFDVMEVAAGDGLQDPTSQLAVELLLTLADATVDYVRGELESEARPKTKKEKRA